MTCKEIKEIVELFSEQKIDIKTHKRHIVYLRWIYFKSCKVVTNNSLDLIGQEVNRDHASVIHGLKNVDIPLKEQYYKDLYLKVLDKINGNTHLFDSDKDRIIEKYKELQEKYELVLSKRKDSKREELLEALMELSNDKLVEFQETRLKPFLLMNKSA